MSEQSDALVIVVSEETGVISAAHGGSFQRYLDLEMLRQAAYGNLYRANKSKSTAFIYKAVYQTLRERRCCK